MYTSNISIVLRGMDINLPYAILSAFHPGMTMTSFVLSFAQHIRHGVKL